MSPKKPESKAKELAEQSKPPVQEELPELTQEPQPILPEGKPAGMVPNLEDRRVEAEQVRKGQVVTKVTFPHIGIKRFDY